MGETPQVAKAMSQTSAEDRDRLGWRILRSADAFHSPHLQIGTSLHISPWNLVIIISMCQWKTMTFMLFHPDFLTIPISFTPGIFFQATRLTFTQPISSARRNRIRWYFKPGTLRDKRCTIRWRTSSSRRQVHPLFFEWLDVCHQ